ncbi:MAG: phenylalanine--tRNA ligase subunit alpha [Polyangiales bacterium]
MEQAVHSAAFETADEAELRQLRSRLLGPKGELTQLLRSLKSLPPEARRSCGQHANRSKAKLEARFGDALEACAAHAQAERLARESIDVTLPGRDVRCGHLHPLSQVRTELVDILRGLGFSVAEGPEVDKRQYNFDMLGFPPDHPAADMQDSFFLQNLPEWLLRTHTSTVQVREMLRRQPPLAVISPGTVYRRDDDPTHSPMFSQLEALWIDRDVSFADLKGVLHRLLTAFFGSEARLRFRPSYFPFVEPGGEVDVALPVQGGAERGETRWMEVLGCGMVHPVVLEGVGIDPEHQQGFAFGLGIDRFTMLRHGIDDIRLLYDNDPRFLAQF